MVDAATLRRLALALPGAVEASEGGRLVCEVAGKGFAWTYMRRVDPKKPRQPDPSAIAVRCELPRKELLVEAAPYRFFDDDHYRGFPAVLVRLAAVDEPELADLLEGAHRLRLAIKPRTPRKRRRRS